MRRNGNDGYCGYNRYLHTDHGADRSAKSASAISNNSNQSRTGVDVEETFHREMELLEVGEILRVLPRHIVAPRMCADLVLLDGDPLKCKDAEEGANGLEVWKAGRMMYLTDDDATQRGVVGGEVDYLASRPWKQRR